MGYEDRAGSYSYDLFERSIGRNLDQLDPDIPPLAPGGTMPFYPGAPMTVAVAHPPRALALWQVTSRGRAIDPAGPWGDDHVAWSWAFVLEPVDATRTRLLVRMRVGYRPAVKWGPAMWLLVEPATSSWVASAARHPTARRDRPAPDDQERTAPPATAGAEAVAEAVRPPDRGRPVLRPCR
jgi:hypothetical protein